MTLLNVAILVVATVLLVPVLVFCAECLAALLPARQLRRRVRGPRPSVAVIVPAHNEAAGLGAVLDSIVPQLHTGDRLILVADNCDDSTATVARAKGAIVLERHDLSRRGKGFALDFGVRHLEMNPPDVVVMMDADCTASPWAIDALVEQVMATDRPAQACYLMEQPPQAKPKDLVSSLAFLVKNWVRPAGLVRLGLPCLLTGTGMAFPWLVIREAKLASGNIVEDMQLSIDLAIANHAPLFCAAARVTGRLPAAFPIAYQQRTRWEHGHLQTFLQQVPRLFRAGLARFKLQPLALAMDVAVPPLALLVLVMSFALVATFIAGHFGATWLAFKLVAGGIGAVGVTLAASWAKFARRTLPLMSLLAAPFYVAWKVPMYFAFIFRRQTEWVRTARPAGDFELPPAGRAGVLNRDLPSPALLDLDADEAIPAIH